MRDESVGAKGTHGVSAKKKKAKLGQFNTKEDDVTREDGLAVV
jgi:hypothetical protein